MTSDNPQPSPQDPPCGDKPLTAILGRPRLRPGETKEDAARRLARELFGKLKPPEPSQDHPTTTSHE